MDEAEARARCAQLAESSDDRSTHSWLPKQKSDGSWTVVKLAVPSPAGPDTVKTVSTGNESAKDDPRPAMEQNIPPHTIWG